MLYDPLDDVDAVQQQQQQRQQQQSPTFRIVTDRSASPHTRAITSRNYQQGLLFTVVLSCEPGKTSDILRMYQRGTGVTVYMSCRVRICRVLQNHMKRGASDCR